jgi:hypothetical protein
MSDLRYLCLFVYSSVQDILCCVVFSFSSSCVRHVHSFSGMSPFFITPSVFSNVYLFYWLVHYNLYIYSKSFCSTPSLFIKVPVPSQENDRSCVLGVSIFCCLCHCSDSVVFCSFHFLFDAGNTFLKIEGPSSSWSYAGADPEGGRTRRAPPLKLEKIRFFGVKSWFFTRNTPKNFPPPSARRNFFKCAPPNLKSWIRPWYGSYNLQLHAKSVPITTNVVSLNPADGEVYSIQHYVIQFVSDLRQVDGFLQVFRFPPPIKLTTMI